MDERRALLLAAIAHPDEDTPRLALADWLEENGDADDCARAEFIRLQCRIARVTDTSPRTVQLHARADDLLNTHARAWMGALWDLTGDGYRDRDFTRGFLSWWYTTAGAFVKKAHQKAVCERFPVLGVERLMLTEKSTRAKAIADSPALGWTSEFVWRRSQLTDDGFRTLVASPHTSRTSMLHIDRPSLGDAALRALAKSPNWPNLRAFGLTEGTYHGRYTSQGVLALLNSTALPRLNELNLSGAQPTGFESPALYQDPGLQRLRALRRGPDAVMRHFAASTQFTNLEEFSLNGGTVSDAAAEALLANAAFAKLRKLVLINANAGTPALSKPVERRLRDRFGDGFELRYSAHHQ